MPGEVTDGHLYPALGVFQGKAVDGGADDRRPHGSGFKPPQQVPDDRDLNHSLGRFRSGVIGKGGIRHIAQGTTAKYKCRAGHIRRATRERDGVRR